jgi:hypothetical protein
MIPQQRKPILEKKKALRLLGIPPKLIMESSSLLHIVTVVTGEKTNIKKHQRLPV